VTGPVLDYLDAADERLHPPAGPDPAGSQTGAGRRKGAAPTTRPPDTIRPAPGAGSPKPGAVATPQATAPARPRGGSDKPPCEGPSEMPHIAVGVVSARGFGPPDDGRPVPDARRGPATQTSDRGGGRAATRSGHHRAASREPRARSGPRPAAAAGRATEKRTSAWCGVARPASTAPTVPAYGRTERPADGLMDRWAGAVGTTPGPAEKGAGIPRESTPPAGPGPRTGGDRDDVQLHLGLVPGWLAAARRIFLAVLWAAAGWLGWLGLDIYLYYRTH